MSLLVAIVRVRQTLRRQTGPHLPAVQVLWRHLESIGFDGAAARSGRPPGPVNSDNPLR